MKTLKDVAELANVHTSTVSRVLRGKEDLRIPEETREKIFAAAKKLNYYPDQAARSLRLKKSHTIGLIVPDISNPFFARISRTIEESAYKIGYTVIVCNTDEDQEKEDHFMNVLLQRRIDGLILCPVQDSKEKICEMLGKNFPFVLIDRYFEDIETNAVVSDNHKSAYEAVSYLVSKGHRRIAFVKGRKNIYTIQKRLEGYMQGVEDFKLDADPELIVGDGYCLEDGYVSAMRLLDMKQCPTAILASGNLVSVGVMKGLIEKGIKIPDDISIIAYADNVFSPYLMTPLTTVSHPLQMIGTSAFNLLMQHLDSKEPLPFSKIILQSNLEKRKSVEGCSL